jgi:hypothetical protein
MDLFAENPEIIKDVFKALIVGELLEIREVVHEDDTIIKDDKNYIHSANIKIYTNDRKHFNSFKIPKLKKSIDDVQLQNLVLLNIKLNNLKPDIVQITKNYKQ